MTTTKETAAAAQTIALAAPIYTSGRKIWQQKCRKLREVTILGMSLPVYTLVAILILASAKAELLPNNMVGALAVMMILGSLFNLLGSRIPIIRSYLGGAVFCIFASSALATYTILPESVTANCEAFMNDVGFLDCYIAALITGSILGMDRNLLKKSAVRFLPIAFASMTCAILMAGVAGVISGRGFGDTILYIALPMMSGGMGAGVIPLSGRMKKNQIRPRRDLWTFCLWVPGF